MVEDFAKNSSFPRACRYIQKQELVNGYTGKVAFDENGDRINAEYEVVNMQSGGRSVTVGNYKYSGVSS